MRGILLIRRLSGCVVVGAWLILFALAGCGPRQRSITSEEQNLSQLSRLYGLYISKNQGKSPANLEELKTFAQKSDPAERRSRGVTAEDVNSIFVSSRDNQPFVYRRPKGTGAPGVPGVGGESVIFYEQTGAGGKRYVAYTTPGKVEEVDADKFKQLVPEAP